MVYRGRKQIGFVPGWAAVCWLRCWKGGKTAVLLDDTTLSSNQLSYLTQIQPEYGTLYLVDAYDLPQIVSLLQAGITGVLSRNATLPELIQAFIAVSRGEIVLPPTLAARALVALARGEMHPKTSEIETLTDREQEVLTSLAQGLTNKDIAQTLFLSVRTVEAHLRNIYSKLNVNSRTEAVLWAVQHGYDS